MGNAIRITKYILILLVIILSITLFEVCFTTANADENQFVSLHLDGSTVAGYTPDENGVISLKLVDTLTLPSAHKNGYAFLGWTKTQLDEDSEYITEVTIANYEQLKTLYARFTLLPLTVVTQPTSYSAVYSDSIQHTLSFVVSHPLAGDATISYQWFKNNTAIVGATTNTLTVQNCLDSGEYHCSALIEYANQGVQTTSSVATVDIQKATVGELDNIILEGTYDANKTLADYTLPEHYFWVDTSICPTVANRTYQAIYSLGENFLDKNVLITIVLQKAKQSINANNFSKVYDGQACSIEATSSSGGKIEYSTNNSLINVGREIVVITAEESENYLSAIAFAILEVIPQEVAVVWTDGAFVYNGEVQLPTFSAVSAEGVALDIVVDKSPINAGSYSLVASLDNSNYTLTNSTFDYAISKQEVAVVWTDGAFVYNGEVQLPTFSAVSAEGVALDIVVDKSPINAGSYSLVASLDNNNYTLTNSTFDYAISKQEVTVTWEELSFVYDGNSHIPTANCVNAKRENIELSLNEPQINAGNYTAIADFKNATLGGNYTLINTTMTYTINKANYADESIVVSDRTVIYDGTEYSLIVEDLPESVSVSYDNSYIQPGYYTINAIFNVSNPNYNDIPQKTAKLTILRTTFSSSWYEINCPQGVNPDVEFSLELINDLDGLRDKNNGKLDYLLGFKVNISDNSVYDKPISVSFNFDEVSIDNLMLSVDDKLNEQIITYAYVNGKVVINIDNLSNNFVLAKRSQSLFWLIPLIIGVCGLVCGVVYMINKKKIN